MPMQITPKKTVLIDFLQIENRDNMPKSTDNHAFLKENAPEVEPVNISTAKRTEPVDLVNQSPSTNAANGHLVYVRRKTKTESSKSNMYVSRKDNSFCSQLKRVGEQHQTTQGKQTQETPICIPETEPMPTSPLTCFPFGKPSTPSSFWKSPSCLQEVGSSNCNLSLSIGPSDYPKRMNNHYWEERNRQLQDFLEVLDHSNQENYVQMLRSLPQEGLSAQAIELEKRSILLSMEEAKELQRVPRLDLLGKGKYAKKFKRSLSF